eukprot:GHVL01033393.1.p1 GENE.GHVL01033393.1~~GHVL01033393.1.p1  ORF type:complete len:726 (+),score=167.70 GHVL01033393.1:155-2332(+)
MFFFIFILFFDKLRFNQSKLTSIAGCDCIDKFSISGAYWHGYKAKCEVACPSGGVSLDEANCSVVRIIIPDLASDKFKQMAGDWSVDLNTGIPAQIGKCDSTCSTNFEIKLDIPPYREFRKNILNIEYRLYIDDSTEARKEIPITQQMSWYFDTDRDPNNGFLFAAGLLEYTSTFYDPEGEAQVPITVLCPDIENEVAAIDANRVNDLIVRYKTSESVTLLDVYPTGSRGGVCASDNGGCDANARCFDVQSLGGGVGSGGGVTCRCRTGWIGDGITCTDAQECAQQNGTCGQRAVCVERDGSPPFCGCPTGFYRDSTGCADLDECSLEWSSPGQSVCSTSSKCVNQVGAPPNCSFDIERYDEIKSAKFDPFNFCPTQEQTLDRIVFPSSCVTKRCQTHYICIDTTCGAQCVDMKLYTLDNLDSYETVVTDQIEKVKKGFFANLRKLEGNERMLGREWNPEACPPTDDLYTESLSDKWPHENACPPGTVRTPLQQNQTDCLDIDECKMWTNGGCDPESICVNRPRGAPNCILKPGFTEIRPVSYDMPGCLTDTQRVLDINECNVNHGGCSEFAYCVNQIGAPPLCYCITGFTGNGYKCVIIPTTPPTILTDEPNPTMPDLTVNDDVYPTVSTPDVTVLYNTPGDCDFHKCNLNHIAVLTKCGCKCKPSWKDGKGRYLKGEMDDCPEISLPGFNREWRGGGFRSTSVSSDGEIDNDDVRWHWGPRKP